MMAHFKKFERLTNFRTQKQDRYNQWSTQPDPQSRQYEWKLFTLEICFFFTWYLKWERTYGQRVKTMITTGSNCEKVKWIITLQCHNFFRTFNAASGETSVVTEVRFPDFADEQRVDMNVRSLLDLQGLEATTTTVTRIYMTHWNEFV